MEEALAFLNLETACIAAVRRALHGTHGGGFERDRVREDGVCPRRAAGRLCTDTCAWMVKGSRRRKFQRPPVDFGVVGVEEGDDDDDDDDEDDDEPEDSDLDAESDADVESRGEWSSYRQDSLDRGLKTVSSASYRATRSTYTSAMVVKDVDSDEADGASDDADDLIAVDGFDDGDESDLISLDTESERDATDVEEAGRDMDALSAYLSTSAPFYSASLHDFVAERREQPLLASGRLPGEHSRLWVAAISPASRFREVKNQYDRVGVLLAANFEDFMSNPDVDVNELRIEDESLFKAKAAFFASGAPALSVSTSFEVEGGGGGVQGQRGIYLRTSTPSEVDMLLDRLRPRSEKTRVVTFRSMVAFYDGVNEILTEGAVDVAIEYAASQLASVAVASAFDNMFKELWKLFHLQLVEVESEETQAMNNAGGSLHSRRLMGALMLHERILREGKSLTGGIIKVSSFLNHMVDAELMDLCGEELAERLRHTMPNKVLTVEATGLIPALSVARRLNVSVVFARKERPITISESYQTMYRSKTKGKLNELIVSTEYLHEGDRVLLIDDFLAGGSTVEALFKLANMARARVVGLGVLIEKTSEGGRAFVSGYDVPVHSLVRVKVLTDGTIDVQMDEPFSVPVADGEGEE